MAEKIGILGSRGLLSWILPVALALVTCAFVLVGTRYQPSEYFAESNLRCVASLKLGWRSDTQTVMLVSANRKEESLRNYCESAVYARSGHPFTEPMLLGADLWEDVHRRELIAWLTAWQYAKIGDANRASAAEDEMGIDAQSSFDQLILQQAVKAESAGDIDAAVKMHKVRIANNPDDLWRYESLAQMLMRHNEPDAAAQVFLEGARSSKGQTRAYLEGRAAEQQMQWEDAAYSFQISLSYGNSDPLVYFHLAQTLGIRLGDVRTAISLCREAVRMAPRDYACYELLGILHEHIGELDTAAMWYMKGLDNIVRSSYRAMFWRRLGDLANEQSAFDKATHYFQQAIIEKPLDALSYYGLARAAVGALSPADAIGFLETAIALRESESGKAPSSWYTKLGELYEDSGQVESALNAYETARSLEPTDQTILQAIERLSHYDD